MSGRLTIMLFFQICFCAALAQAYEIDRFELLNTEQGLSQNSVMSGFCDSRGYLWVGTMDGLNRYDGYEFEVYKSDNEDLYSLNNNRITSIWEDQKGFIWLKTHDGYMHCFDQSSERFYTYPMYRESDEEKASSINCFSQLSSEEIWLGSSSSGAYRLCYREDSVYRVQEFKSRGPNPITNNSITFICEDPLEQIWVGTDQGLNRFTRTSENEIEQAAEHLLVDHSFTTAISTSSHLWMGTRKHGIIRYLPLTRKFSPLFLGEGTRNMEVTSLHLTRDEHYMVIGTSGKGVFLYNRSTGKVQQYELQGFRVNSIFEDSYGAVWITTDAFGVSMINPDQGNLVYHILSPPETHQLIDAERPFFFEDTKKNLWVGTHGGGLGFFDRGENRFSFSRNDPEDPSSIKSNFVYTVFEDQSGLIWVGTGQFNGGINKVIPRNPTFSHFQPKKSFNDYAENVIRCIFQDREHHIWLANKSGEIFIYDENLNLIRSLNDLPLKGRLQPGVNVYSMMQDREGYLWMGSKGGGVAVSSKSLHLYQDDFRDLEFNQYTRENSGAEGLSSNMIYSIVEDCKGEVWIGTYGGGILKVLNRTEGELTCAHYDASNSSLKSPNIRLIYEDSRERLWFATTFGAHLLESTFGSDSAYFRSFVSDPDDPGALSYNDVIHIFEDTEKNLWFATFGGGLNKLEEVDSPEGSFTALNDRDGLVNNSVFGILQDSLGYLWISTVNGISRIDPVSNHIENYNNSNGLLNSNFNESACLLTLKGEMIFGNTKGIAVISPGKVEKSNFIPPVVFTKFYLSNQVVDFKDKGSPIGRHIDYLEKIELNYDQSSFSLEYAALSYFDPRKNQYAYKLENFDEEWNSLGNERRASYTKVPPGEYTLLVKGSSWDDTWNEQARSLSIIIKPPWWKTLLAKIIYVILFLVVAEISRRVLMNYYRLRNDLMVEKRINEIKLQFFTNISHEIRTPLTLILGPVDDLKMIKNLPASIMEPLEIIQRNSKRILRLVNQLLDFRKIQNKKMKLKVQQVNLGRFLIDVCHNFDYLAIQKKIQFQYPLEIPETLVWFDPDKMDTVLFNLLSNAFKFTPAGKSIIVDVKLTQNGELFEVIVRDEGSGIPEEKLSLMFQRYTSLATEKMTLTGTGIGLAFSNEIVKAHKGTMLVDSKIKQGSTFVVKIPALRESYDPSYICSDSIAYHSYDLENQELATLEQDFAEVSYTLEEATEASRPRILLVEDHYDIRQYIRKLLVAEFEITEAANGIEGLKMLQQSDPDLIITDLMMSEMDGIEMTRKLKNDFNTSHIPVIMLTARSTIDNQIEGIESGAEAYILKPFNALYLKTVIRNLLNQRNILNQKLITEQHLNLSEIKITNRDEIFIKEVIRIIEAHYHESDFSVDKLVEYSNVGRTVFYNKIKSLTGGPPVQFLRQVRIKIAAKLLTSNGYNISEIAYMTGFSDIKYFRKCFKGAYGVTPSEYKEKQAGRTG